MTGTADAREAFGLVLYGLAALGAVLVVRSLVRMFAVARAGRTLRACRRLPQDHRRHDRLP